MRILALWVLLAAVVTAPAAAFETRYVILVTADGLRHQELFTGAEAALIDPANKKSSGIESTNEIRREFWHDDPAQRRERLMPFLWGELSREGIIYGNRARGSKVVVRNPHHFSYPGYAEILNGQYLPEVTSNDAKFSPRETLVEFLQKELRLTHGAAAVFGSWSIFNWIATQRENGVFVNAGYESLPESWFKRGPEAARARLFDQLQYSMRSPWDSVRHDTVTLELALAHWRLYQPRFLYIALGETDDWAHDRRYDLVLRTARLFDDALRQIWTTAQSLRPYRGRTTMIVTTDHGRGRTLEDWTSHKSDVPGADETWIGIFGPDTPKLGEAANMPDASASNIAATILSLYGLDPARFNPHAAPPIPGGIAPKP